MGVIGRIRISGDPYVIEDATDNVEVPRSLADVWRGEPGKHDRCMNYHAIIRNGARFKHPVIAASVLRTVVYVIDRPGHAYRYTLSKADTRRVDKHDEFTLGQPGTLILRAPKGKQRLGRPRHAGEHVHPDPNKGAKRKRYIGEQARVEGAVGALNLTAPTNVPPVV